MPTKGKTYRINKVATEFNVSWKTIVEHLQSKGFEVEAKITAKLDADMYNELLSFYQKDKIAKEESQQLEINIRKDAKTQGIKEAKKSHSTKDDEDIILIKDSNVSSKPIEEVKEEKPAEPPKAEPPKVEAEKVAEEEKVEEKQREEVIEEPVDEKTPEEEASPEVETPKEKISGPKVLGTIDIKPKKDPKKEKKEEEEKPKEEETVVESEKEDAPEEEEKDEQIETQYKKLQGTKVLGSIELPKVVKKEKSKDGDNSPKKRRKRIRGEKMTPEKLRQEQRKNVRKKEDGKEEVSEKEIQDKIKQTLARMSSQKRNSQGGGTRRKARKQRRQDHKQSRDEQQVQDELQSKVLQVTEFVTANELANMMNVSVNDIISACFTLGMMVSINQRLDAETLQIVSEEFGYSVEFIDASETIDIVEEEDDPEDLVGRHPIVTVMGHVDHGKTSLLDYIRNANVIAGEAGGITQHTAAYGVELKNGSKITFIDTPGHEAFTAMRARGAKVTDIAIIVIAADDAVMPQTKEAISHAQAAEVPLIFAFNKMDKDGANADRVREQLSQMNILVEEWGGKYQSQEISAKNGTNIDELLDKVLLEAELLELKANPDKAAKGAVLEAKIEKGRGVVASLLVQEGTLKIGDALIAGKHFARIKAMFNERGTNVTEAGPAAPISVLGFSGTPAAGDTFQVMEEQKAKEIAQKREQLQREQGIRATKHVTLEEIGRRLAVGNFKELNVIIKADVDGSAEALSDSLIKLSTEEIQVNVIHKSVGPISDTDVMLATASDAVIIGFQVRPMPSARKLAESEEIEIRLYSVIYKAIEEIKSAMEGLLDPDVEEQITGTAEIRELFKITKVGTVAGCMITEGKMFRDNKVRLIREGVVIYSGELEALKRFKDDVKEVNKGYECGIQIKNYNDIQIGDLIEGFREVEVKRKLK